MHASLALRTDGFDVSSVIDEFLDHFIVAGRTVEHKFVIQLFLSLTESKF